MQLPDDTRLLALLIRCFNEEAVAAADGRLVAFDPAEFLNWYEAELGHHRWDFEDEWVVAVQQEAHNATT